MIKKASFFRRNFSSILLLVAISSCQVDECDEVVPQIAFKSIITGNDNVAMAILSFKDCDGDLGLNDNEVDSPFQYNLFCEYYYLVDGQWILLDLSSDTNAVPYYFRIPFLDNKATSTVLEGEIEVELRPYFIPGLSDTVKFTAMLKDRALNESNVVESPIIIGQQ